MTIPTAPRTVTVLTRTISYGRCRQCLEPVIWVTRASTPGSPAKALPFDQPRPVPLSTSTNAQNGQTFEVWPVTKLHFTTCKKPRPTARRRK